MVRVPRPSGHASMQDFELKYLPPRTLFYLRCRGPWRRLPSMLAALSQERQRAGIAPAGAPGAFYYNTPGEVSAEDLVWEVFYPVAPDTPPHQDDITGFGVRTIAGASVAVVLHEGPFTRTGPSYRRLDEWIKAQGMSVSGPAEEAYLTDISGADEAPRIEIRLPVKAPG